jgi:hypothetical protein
MKITYLLVFLPCNMLANTVADIAAAFFVWEAVRRSLETSVNFYHTKLCDIPEYCVLYSYRNDNLRYRTFKLIWNKIIICVSTTKIHGHVALIWLFGGHKSTAFCIHLKSLIHWQNKCQFQVNFRCVSFQCRLLTFYEERKWSSCRVLTEHLTVVNKVYIYNLVLK